jgi:hypothetical protein
MNPATIIEPHQIRDRTERTIGQPACPSCGGNPCRTPTFCRACRDADARKARGEKSHYIDAQLWGEPARDFPALLDRSVSLERAWAQLTRHRSVDAPRATVEALLYELRTHGLIALKNPNCRQRLADLSDMQLRSVLAALIPLRARYVAVTDELLIALDRIRQR